MELSEPLTQSEADDKQKEGDEENTVTDADNHPNQTTSDSQEYLRADFSNTQDTPDALSGRNIVEKECEEE